MGSVNKVILIGNLGADPEVRYTQSGSPVCNLRIATNERWKDNAGETQEKTEWHRVVVFGNQAEICRQYLRKGRTVYIEGQLQTREWQDQQGQRRFSTEVKGRQVVFLGGDGGGGGGRRGGGGDWGGGGGGGGDWGGGGASGGGQGTDGYYDAPPASGGGGGKAPGGGAAPAGGTKPAAPGGSAPIGGGGGFNPDDDIPF